MNCSRTWVLQKFQGLDFLPFLAGPNRTLLKISSSPHGVDTIASGKAEFATRISDSTITQVLGMVMVWLYLLFFHQIMKGKYLKSLRDNTWMK